MHVDIAPYMRRLAGLRLSAGNCGNAAHGSLACSSLVEYVIQHVSGLIAGLLSAPQCRDKFWGSFWEQAHDEIGARIEARSRVVISRSN